MLGSTGRLEPHSTLPGHPEARPPLGSYPVTHEDIVRDQNGVNDDEILNLPGLDQEGQPCRGTRTFFARTVVIGREC